MLLYHGSNVVVKEPKVIPSEKGRDFGHAFYLTPIKEQAERMAKRKSKIYPKSKPYISIFEWNENINGLNYKEFENADKEWLELILQCRTIPTYQHGFDIVKGKIADDSVGETILFVIDGVIGKDEAIKRLKYQKVNSQIAFCSEASLKTLSFVDSYEVKK